MSHDEDKLQKILVQQLINNTISKKYSLDTK